MRLLLNKIKKETKTLPPQKKRLDSCCKRIKKTTKQTRLIKFINKYPVESTKKLK